MGNANWDNHRCEFCPVKKWNATGKYCNDYHTVEDRLDDLIRYITNCITNREKFNIGAYMNLRKAIMKKMYIGVHINLRNAILRRLEFLEWRYEE